MKGFIFISILTFVCCNSTIPLECNIIREAERFDCFPDEGANENACVNRGCCWIPSSSKRHLTDIQAPYCFFPRNFPHYKVLKDKVIIGRSSASYYLSKTTPSFRPNEILDLTLDIFYDTEKRLRVSIYDRNKSRYEVPLDVDKNSGNRLKKSSNVDYYVNIVDEPFAIKVFRKSTESLMYVLISKKFTCFWKV